MKLIFRKLFARKYLSASLVLLLGLWFVSCNDEYYYDEVEPEWLGESIYDYLDQDGNYTYYVRLIDDTGYKATLEKTGSKTLFVVKDEVFEAFLRDNQWGVSTYDELSQTQKNLILKYGMIDNAYLMETLANYNSGGLQKGTAIRRNTSLSIYDSVKFETGNELPDNPHWARFKEKGIYYLEDNTPKPLVHFLEKPLLNAGVSDSDFELITGVPRNPGDAHIFEHKVIEKDITCKNGYIHVLDKVLLPRKNLAQHLSDFEETSVFSKLLDRFCAPYFQEEIYTDYRIYKPEFNDSLFVKGYFTSNTGSGPSYYPNGEMISNELLLPFNPSNNRFISSSATAMQSDMAAILAPTNAAMSDYFNNGAGLILKERYGSWDNIPDDIIALLLKRHMRESFLSTIPVHFSKMNDSENSPINITVADIQDTYVANNGVAYHTNKVYPPDDYVSIYAPVLFSDKAKIMNWVIRQNDFRFYLNSLVSTYSFFVPTDNYFDEYIDPVAYGQDVPGVIKFWYNEEDKTVNGTVYGYNMETGEVGDSLAVIETAAFLSDRLLRLLDLHIVIGDVETGETFYPTKGGNMLKIEGSGQALKVQGGHDIKTGNAANVVTVYNQENGNTYFIDKPIQAPLQSVYSVLNSNPEFARFKELLEGFPNSNVLVRRANYSGIDFNIKFFNTFNYTVYVPTNEAIEKAILDGVIPSWDQINETTDDAIKKEMITKLERFVRYHFQDNSVFISGKSVNAVYQSATIKLDDEATRFGTYKNKYHKIGIQGDGNGLTISTDANEDYGLNAANVVTENGLYNIMTQDYVFNNLPRSFKNIDGTGVGTDFRNSRINTFSTAVVHQIDNILRFE